MSIETKDIVNLWRRRPVLCGCALIVAGLLMLLYFRIGDRDALEGSLSEQIKLRNKLNANIKYGNGLTEQTERLRAVNAKLSSSALKVGELALNQQFFLRLEADAEIKILDFRPLAVPAPVKDAPANAFVPLGFALSVSGNYDQLITFLKRLEQNSTLSRVVTASTGAGGSGPQTLSLSVELLGLRP